MRTERYFVLRFAISTALSGKVRGRIFVRNASEDAAIQAALSRMSDSPDWFFVEEVDMKTYYAEVRR